VSRATCFVAVLDHFRCFIYCYYTFYGFWTAIRLWVLPLVYKCRFYQTLTIVAQTLPQLVCDGWHDTNELLEPSGSYFSSRIISDGVKIWPFWW